MTKQAEALCLADSIEQGCDYPPILGDAAAELRRLSSENERLKAACLSIAEGWRKQSEQLEAGRDTLLAALRWIAATNAMDYEYQAVANTAIERFSQQ